MDVIGTPDQRALPSGTPPASTGSRPHLRRYVVGGALMSVVAVAALGVGARHEPTPPLAGDSWSLNPVGDGSGPVQSQFEWKLTITNPGATVPELFLDLRGVPDTTSPGGVTYKHWTSSFVFPKGSPFVVYPDGVFSVGEVPGGGKTTTISIVARGHAPQTNYFALFAGVTADPATMVDTQTGIGVTVGPVPARHSGPSVIDRLVGLPGDILGGIGGAVGRGLGDLRDGAGNVLGGAGNVLGGVVDEGLRAVRAVEIAGGVLIFGAVGVTIAAYRRAALGVADRVSAPAGADAPPAPTVPVPTRVAVASNADAAERTL